MVVDGGSFLPLAQLLPPLALLDGGLPRCCPLLDCGLQPLALLEWAT